MEERFRNHIIERFVENVYRAVYQSNWECLNMALENYDRTAFSQNDDIVKYKLCVTNGEIAAIYFTIDRIQNKYNIEVVFEKDPATVYELPLNENCYATLKELETELSRINERNLDDLIDQHLRF